MDVRECLKAPMCFVGIGRIELFWNRDFSLTNNLFYGWGSEQWLKQRLLLRSFFLPFIEKLREITLIQEHFSLRLDNLPFTSSAKKNNLVSILEEWKVSWISHCQLMFVFILNFNVQSLTRFSSIFLFSKLLKFLCLIAYNGPKQS
jgi:hypothetical protein